MAVTGSEVRCRFAPAPSGSIHVGNARTALFSWLTARHHGGTFVLRVEDTDASRVTEEAVRGVLESLTWLGLDHDEGPEAGGPHAPYRQSERRGIYTEHVDRLLGVEHVQVGGVLGVGPPADLWLPVQQGTRVERREQPLVGVDDEAVGRLDPGEAVLRQHAKRLQRSDGIQSSSLLRCWRRRNHDTGAGRADERAGRPLGLEKSLVERRRPTPAVRQRLKSASRETLV